MTLASHGRFASRLLALLAASSQGVFFLRRGFGAPSEAGGDRRPRVLANPVAPGEHFAHIKAIPASSRWRPGRGSRALDIDETAL